MSDPIQKVPLALDLVFPEEYLNSPAEGDHQGRKNREVQEEVRNVRKYEKTELN